MVSYLVFDRCARCGEPRVIPTYSLERTVTPRPLCDCRPGRLTKTEDPDAHEPTVVAPRASC